ncbi:MAG: Ig-like domain-containing protein [Treponema sp.]|nr:Ig-like domain-containing protein [Treponema sp.]
MRHIYCWGQLIFYLIVAACFSSCASWLLPPLEIVAVYENDNAVAILFSLEPDRNALIDAFSFSEDGAVCSGKFCFNNKEVVFYPANGIALGHVYEISITTNAESVLGRSLMETFVHTFIKKDDLSRPRVVSIVPENETMLADSIAEITISFSKPVEQHSFQDAFSIKPAASNRLVWNEQRDCVKVCFDAPLSLTKRYTVKITTSLCDTNNNYLAEEFSAVFFNGTDFEAPTYTLSYIYNDTSVLIESYCDNVPRAACFQIDFSEETAIDSAVSLISIEPPLMYSTILDKQTKKRITIEFADVPEWEKEYVIKISKGIADISGNKTHDDKSYLIKFNNEQDRPIHFIEGIFKIKDFDFVYINEATNYSHLILPVEIFPTIVEKETVYYALFRISSTASSLDYISVLLNINIMATQSCASFLIKEIELLDAHTIYASEIGGIDAVENAKSCAWNICAAKCTVVVENADNRGLVRFVVNAELQDTNGNILAEDVRYTYSKS